MATRPHINRPAAGPAEGVFSVRELLEAVWRRKWVLVTAVLVALAFAGVYVFQAEPIYEVHARLLVERQSLPHEEPHDLRREEEFLATQAEILSSPAVVTDALQRRPDLAPSDSLERDPLRMILKSLSASPVTGTNVIQVHFVGRDERPAMKTVAAVIESYQRFSRSLKHDAHRETLMLLTENERQLREELETVEDDYEKLRSNGPVIGQGGTTRSLQQNIVSRLGQTLTEARTRRFALQNQLAALSDSQLAAADRPAGQTSGTVLTSATAPRTSESVPSPAGQLPESILAGSEKLRDIEGKLFEAREREKELALVQGPKNPELRGVREQIAEWERLRAEQVAAAPAMLKAELAAVKSHEEDLQRLYEQELEKARSIDLYLVKEEQSLGEIQRIQDIHESILTQLRDLRLADSALENGGSGLTVSVLQTPTLVASGISPPAYLAVAICAVVGLVGGFGMIMLLENALPGGGPITPAAAETSELNHSEQWEENDHANRTAATERVRRPNPLPAR